MEFNHLYIEKTLRPAYTVGLMFIFQDGVMRDVFASNSSNGSAVAASESAVSQLAFVNNKQLVDVNLSSPLSNVLTALTGAALFLVLSIVIAITSQRKEALLQRFLSTHNIAELFTNTTKFPSSLLHTTLDEGEADLEKSRSQASSARTNGHEISSTLDGFRVVRMELVHPDGRGWQITQLQKLCKRKWAEVRRGIGFSW
uniref:Uncharacterized protein n=1 Tax=Globisporangium ultimum (strain ATCC 200006 / CBS 805.95 / DAOM BR144) TaxID=431595 RepID=K3X017_GLOUD